MPNLRGILETALHVDDLPVACAFYEEVIGLANVTRDARLCSYDVAGRSILLLFRRGGSREGDTADGGNEIPPHDGSGPVHVAFEAEAGTMPDWERHLAAHRIPILSRTESMRGGRSLYFRDPDGHLLELAFTLGTWPGH